MSFTEKAQLLMKGCTFTDEETGFICHIESGENPDSDYCIDCQARIAQMREDLQDFKIYLENCVKKNHEIHSMILHDISQALKVLEGEKNGE